MTQLAIDIAICLIIAAIIGAVIGFLIAKIFFCGDEKITDEHKPHLIDKPTEPKDDLKYISGIGTNIEKTLNENGIYYFDQIASWSKKNILWIDEYLKVFKGRAQRDNWVRQAKILNEGKDTPFSLKVKKGDIAEYE
ncbi:MAG: hypothetical protein DRG11_01900 [Epsilonproteobacteria bacterium]|nr:MAG: hypothetical protein DRG11_01900 [Campylobacterota bacterium]